MAHDDPLARLSAWLAGEGDAPAEAASLLAAPHIELELLRVLCRGRRARSRVAAEVLAALLPGSSEAEPEAPGAPERRAPERDDAVPIGDWSEGLRDAQEAAQRVMALEDEVARLSPWLGVGWHRDGSALVDVVHDRLDTLTRLLERRADLARVARELGRIEAAERAGRGVERGGRETVVGVTIGAELADVLPNELALLADPATEDLFYARLVERQLLVLEMSGELEGRVRTERRPGPVIACVDTSGSMIGQAEELAKAATLAVLRRVLRDGRHARVLLFGGLDSVKELDFHPRRADARRLFDLLMAGFHGGTDVDGPLMRALAIRSGEVAFARADLLLVTDGVARLAPATHAALRRARNSGMRVVVVKIGVRGSLLGDLADQTIEVALQPTNDQGAGAL